MASPFDALIAVANTACVTAFGRPSITYHPIGGGASFTAGGILRDPAQLEEISPKTYVHVWFKAASLAVNPSPGDLLTIGAKTYVVFEIDHENEGGGVTLKAQLQ